MHYAEQKATEVCKALPPLTLAAFLGMSTESVRKLLIRVLCVGHWEVVTHMASFRESLDRAHLMTPSNFQFIYCRRVALQVVMKVSVASLHCLQRAKALQLWNLFHKDFNSFSGYQLISMHDMCEDCSANDAQ